jgi:tetratricopeptide (TPR) repeat protein
VHTRNLLYTVFTGGLLLACLSLFFTSLAVTSEVSLHLATLTQNNPAKALEFVRKPYLQDYRLDQRAGQLYLSQGNTKAATEAYQRAVTRNPLKGTLYYDLGWLLLYAQKVSGAEETFTRALLLEPTNAHYLYALGRVKEQQGLAAEALAFYQQALALHDLPKIRARIKRLLP